MVELFYEWIFDYLSVAESGKVALALLTNTPVSYSRKIYSTLKETHQNYYVMCGYISSEIRVMLSKIQNNYSAHFWTFLKILVENLQNAHFSHKIIKFHWKKIDPEKHEFLE